MGQVAVYIVSLYLSMYVMRGHSANHCFLFQTVILASSVSNLECAFYTLRFVVLKYSASLYKTFL